MLKTNEKFYHYGFRSDDTIQILHRPDQTLLGQCDKIYAAVPQTMLPLKIQRDSTKVTDTLIKKLKKEFPLDDIKLVEYIIPIPENIYEHFYDNLG